MSLPEKAFPVSWDQFHRDARALAWRLAGINGEWKAPPTGNLSARLAPASLSALHAASTPLNEPEMTTWPGQLKLAATATLS